jgi:stage V sporulation protein SpoVS
VGQTGPGGGKIFYYNATGFTCGPTLNSTCTYLEVHTASKPKRVDWSDNGALGFSTLNSTGVAIGTGHQNTAVVVAAGRATNVATSAIAFADQFTASNGVDDWFLPSKGEITELFAAYDSNEVLRTPGYTSFQSITNETWTSSQSTGNVNTVWVVFSKTSFGEAFKNGRNNDVILIRAG